MKLQLVFFLASLMVSTIASAQRLGEDHAAESRIRADKIRELAERRRTLDDIRRISEHREVGLSEGWVLAGSTPHLYGVTQAPTLTCGNSVLRSRDGASGEGMGTVMQVFKADAYRGKRIRFSARVQTENVEGWAGLWMRVDGPNARILSFDNMQLRPLKGSTSCERKEVVLDVPAEAERISYGVLLSGKGAVAMTEPRIETVSNDVESTDLLLLKPLPKPLDAPKQKVTD